MNKVGLVAMCSGSGLSPVSDYKQQLGGSSSLNRAVSSSTSATYGVTKTTQRFCWRRVFRTKSDATWVLPDAVPAWISMFLARYRGVNVFLNKSYCHGCRESNENWGDRFEHKTARSGSVVISSFWLNTFCCDTSCYNRVASSSVSWGLGISNMSWLINDLMLGACYYTGTLDLLKIFLLM